jgi:hypothetical protein
MKITKRRNRRITKQQDDQDITDILVAHMMDVKDKQPKYGALIPTEDGCPCGKYKQEYR